MDRSHRSEGRKGEIIDACEALCRTRGYHDITLRDIGNETPFSRPTIYNYFRTKEEIFLALFAREYDRWNLSLERLLADQGPMSAEKFADSIAKTLRSRSLLLRLLSMNLYDMEAGSRVENLTAFKASYGASIRLIRSLLVKFRPEMSDDDRERFVWAFFPFLFGVHPYTAVTEKQRVAMANAGVDFPRLSPEALVSSFIRSALGHRTAANGGVSNQP